MTLRGFIYLIAALGVSYLLVACQSFPKANDVKALTSGMMNTSAQTQIIVLGTGTPVYDVRRAGASLALIHKGDVYLFDVGAGSIRNAYKASQKYTVKNLEPHRISHLFLTHLHSDHTMDFVELANTFWWRREKQLEVFGPKGVKQMSEGMYDMMKIDRSFRTDHGIAPLKNSDIYKLATTEIYDGFFYQKDDLTIEAFQANHGDIRPAFSFKITTPNFSAVISGDTAYSPLLAEKARGVDFLFHEVISQAALAQLPVSWQAYHKKSHTLTNELGVLANIAKPKTLVIYHGISYKLPQETLKNDINKVYKGKIILANDLDRFPALSEGCFLNLGCR